MSLNPQNRPVNECASDRDAGIGQQRLKALTDAPNDLKERVATPNGKPQQKGETPEIAHVQTRPPRSHAGCIASRSRTATHTKSNLKTHQGRMEKETVTPGPELRAGPDTRLPICPPGPQPRATAGYLQKQQTFFPKDDDENVKFPPSAAPGKGPPGPAWSSENVRRNHNRDGRSSSNIKYVRSRRHSKAEAVEAAFLA